MRAEGLARSSVTSSASIGTLHHQEPKPNTMSARAMGSEARPYRPVRPSSTASSHSSARTRGWAARSMR